MNNNLHKNGNQYDYQDKYRDNYQDKYRDNYRDNYQDNYDTYSFDFLDEFSTTFMDKKSKDLLELYINEKTKFIKDNENQNNEKLLEEKLSILPSSSFPNFEKENHWIYLSEATINDLLQRSYPDVYPTRIEKRAKNYRVKLQRVECSYYRNKLLLRFKTSKPNHGTYDTFIQFKNFWDRWKENLEGKLDLRHSDIKNPRDSSTITLSEFLTNITTICDIQVLCTCPSWLYSGYKYKATKGNYAYKTKEHRFPIKRNPRLRGTLCKHLYATLSQFPKFYYQIEKHIQRELDIQNLNIEYSEDQYNQNSIRNKNIRNNNQKKVHKNKYR